jgi:putative thioredoxin
MAGNQETDRLRGLGAGSELAADLVKDTTTASFGPDVITQSAQQPVLVDFWAPWCEPCKQLTPILEKIVRAAGGKIRLAKMNIEEEPAIPGRLGVRSIPAVILFNKGQPVDGFMGVMPESQIRSFIERFVGPLDDSEELKSQAAELLAAGNFAGAAEIFSTILAEDSEDFAAVAGLVEAFVGAEQIDSAKNILASLPPSAERDIAIIKARAAVELAAQASSVGSFSDLTQRIAKDPSDYQARFDYAIALNAQNQRDEAALALLDIIKLDRIWNDDAARKQLLQFFDAWGFMDKATISARRKLSALLFA